MALELVSGVDFWFKLMCGAGPGDLRGPGAAQTPKIDDCRSVKKSYIKNHREMALELVSGADFSCKSMC